MARHPNGARAGQNARNRTYTILLVVLIIGAVIAFYYGPFNKNEAEPPDLSSAPDTNLPENLQADNAMTAASEVNDIVTLTSSEQVVAEANQPGSSTTEVQEQEKPPESDLPGREMTVAGEPNLPGPAPLRAVEPVTAPGAEAAALITTAETFIGTGANGIIAARQKLNEALRLPMSPKQRTSVKEQLSKLSNQWLFSRTVLPNDPLCESYMVKRGETLEGIAPRYKVPWEILKQINNIGDPRTLQAGATIKVIKGPFNAKVYRSTFTMDIYLQNTYVRSYSVGLGKTGRETPTGLWRVRPGGKAYATSWRDPDTGIVYQPDDPDYPLGSRWIALEGLSGEAKDRKGFGIHGTKEPEQIGTAGSRGCIRLHNGDAIQVYNMLVPGLSQVEVTD